MSKAIHELEFSGLPYDTSALEPHIDARTMELHHSKHHNGYFTKLKAASKDTALDNMTLEAVLADISQYSTAVRNNGGGHYNHSLFWEIMGPVQGDMTPSLKTAIDETFGSFDSFRETFGNAAATRFGSGWAWLSVGADGKLFVSSTPNQDNPLMDVADQMGTPILGLDVWEHAYYLNYQNRRPDYINAFWNIVNWTEVSRRYEAFNG